MRSTRTLLPLLLLVWTTAAQAQTAFQKVIELPTDTLAAYLYNPIRTSDGGTMFYVWQDTLRAVVKLDQNGDLLWSKAYPAVPGEAWFHVFNLVPTIDGGAVMILEATDDLDFDVDLYHVRLVRIDAAGAVVWAKRYNVPVDPFMGYCRAEVVPNNTDEFFLRISPDYSAGADPHRVMKLNANGDVLWCTEFDNGPGDPQLRSLFPAQGGGCLMLVWNDYLNNDPTQVALFDGSGNLVWARSVRMTNGDWMFVPSTAIQSSSGEVYIMGYQMSIGPGPHYGYLVKIALNGDLDWYRIYGDGNYTHGATEAVELPSGDLRFGTNDEFIFNPSGDDLAHEQRGFPNITMGSLTYSLGGGMYSSTIVPNFGFLQLGNWTKHDDFFGYNWYKPVISAVPWDLNNTCGWDSTTLATVSDTAVPPAFIEYLTLNNSGPSPYTYADTTTISVAVPLSVSDFCTLLSVGDVAAPANALQVYPSVLSAGMPINAQAKGAERMELLDARGRTVQVVRTAHDAQVSFNSSALRQGLYLVRATDAAGRLLGSARVVVE